jgi:uncharacterized protein YacL
LGFTLFVEGLRLILIGLGVLVGYEAGHAQWGSSRAEDLGMVIGLLVGYLIGGVVGRSIARAAGAASRRFSGMSAAELLAASIMGTAGLVVAALLSLPVILLLKPVISVFIVAALVWILTYFGIRIGREKGQQILTALGVPRRLAPGSGPVPETALIVDTSAAMDRALWALGSNYLLPGELVVPRFVLDELKSMLDSPDPVDARRARRGLELLDALRESSVPFLIAEEEIPEASSEEDRVVTLAERLKGRLATCSTKVIKLAAERGVRAVDLRRLSTDMSPDYVSGQFLEIELIKGGHKPGQAVGYTEDGDMVVVSDASHLVGRGRVLVEVTSSRRTPQGILVFARLVPE